MDMLSLGQTKQISEVRGCTVDARLPSESIGEGKLEYTWPHRLGVQSAMFAVGVGTEGGRHQRYRTDRSQVQI